MRTCSLSRVACSTPAEHHSSRHVLKYISLCAGWVQVGVGTSQLQADMVQQGGYQSILNTDISSVVVRHMQDLHKAMPQLQYRVADARCGELGRG